MTQGNIYPSVTSFHYSSSNNLSIFSFHLLQQVEPTMRLILCFNTHKPSVSKYSLSPPVFRCFENSLHLHHVHVPHLLSHCEAPVNRGRTIPLYSVVWRFHYHPAYYKVPKV
jgi:hypothetical protein